jgi:hypothetical protein
MSFSDVIFITAGVFALAASGAGYAFAKSLERRRSRTASVIAAGDKSSS